MSESIEPTPRGASPRRREAVGDPVAFALAEIAAAHGGVLTPEDTVAAAADPAHILHPRFEWDDTEAAHRYRLDQARALIRAVRVEISTTHHRLFAPIFVRDPAMAAATQGYRSVAAIRSVSEDAQDVMARELGMAAAAIQRAMAVAAALGLMDDLGEVLSRLEAVRRKIARDTAKPPSAS